MRNSMWGVCTPVGGFSVSFGSYSLNSSLIQLVPSLVGPLRHTFVLRNKKFIKHGRCSYLRVPRVGRNSELLHSTPPGFKNACIVVQESRTASCRALTLPLPALISTKKDVEHMETDIGAQTLTSCGEGVEQMQPDVGIREVTDNDEQNVCEKEKVRRQRIAVANKGRVPWNRGRKHSPQTIERIREKTSQAMLSPKVKAKLKLTSRHSQSEETRGKIRIALKEVWQIKSRIRGYQESLCKDWGHCVAEAAKKGGLGEEEMQWNIYSLIKRGKHLDTLSTSQTQRVKREKKDKAERNEKEGKQKGARSGKSEEHRLKISAAIRAKWDDPEYQYKVLQGIRSAASSRTRVKSSTTPKPRPPRKRKPHKDKDICSPVAVVKTGGRALDLGFINAVMSNEKQVDQRDPAMTDNLVPMTRKPHIHQKVNLLKRTTAPMKAIEQNYSKGCAVPGKQFLNDPLVSERLQSSKLLRAYHSDMDQRQSEAAQRARTLIAEAERAVVFLEAIAGDNEFARASLIETKRIIAEAVQFMQRVDLVEGKANRPCVDCGQSHNVASLQSTSPQSLVLQSQTDVNKSHVSIRREDGDFALSSSTRHVVTEYLQPGQDVAVGISSITRNMRFERARS